MIRGEFLADPAAFTVTVKDGIVTLEGDAETSDSATRSCGGSGTSTGVVAVRDRLDYPPPSVPAASSTYWPTSRWTEASAA